MIFDSISNLERYRGTSKGIDLVIDYLRTADLETLPLGRTELDGDTVYFNHLNYTTEPEPATEARLLEAHHKYLDMHVVAAGCEAMAVASVDTLHEVEAHAEEDAVMYKGTGTFQFPIQAGEFAIVYPGEGHLPKVMHNTPSDVNKFVFKIAF